ncbi:MAG TPA: hypothetical protein VEB42_06215 [Chitinophagaceae bacterium]|nr:hypothetical protein [Chitinophagaceae bacterium]
MATQININAYGLQDSKNFHTRISKVTPSNITDIRIDEAGMRRANGYGQYKLFFEGYINGEAITFTKHCTSSPLWDWFNNDADGKKLSDWKKSLIIDLLEEYFETI